MIDQSMPSSYAILQRSLRRLILLNAGPDDRVDLILDFYESVVTFEHYYEGFYKTFWSDDYKVLRMIFRTSNGSLVTARSSGKPRLNYETGRGVASLVMLCESKFVEAFEDAVKKNRLGDEDENKKLLLDGEFCLICHEEYEVGDMMATLACKHGYHVECIKKWLMTKFSCPVCRYRVFPKPIQLYS